MISERGVTAFSGLVRSENAPLVLGLVARHAARSQARAWNNSGRAVLPSVPRAAERAALAGGNPFPPPKLHAEPPAGSCCCFLVSPFSKMLARRRKMSKAESATGGTAGPRLQHVSPPPPACDTRAPAPLLRLRWPFGWCQVFLPAWHPILAMPLCIAPIAISLSQQCKQSTELAGTNFRV